jgi:hypothetical protein
VAVVIAGRARLATVSIFILLAISTTGLGQERDDAFAHQAATRDEAAIQLRSLGQRLVAAVLAHDLETILAADRPDLRAEDRLALQDQTSDLYCFLFDSSCTTVKASVHDIFARARRIDVDVQLIQEKGKPVQGWLIFFDPAKVAKSRLRSPSYLCKHGGQIASWMFSLTNGEWVSANEIFDTESDILCPPR